MWRGGQRLLVWFAVFPLNAYTFYLSRSLPLSLLTAAAPPPPLPFNFHSIALQLHIIIMSHWIHFHVTFRCRWMSRTDQTFCWYENRQEPTIPIMRWRRPPKSPPLNALRTNTSATITSAWPVISAATASQTALTHRMNSTATTKTGVSHLWSIHMSFQKSFANIRPLLWNIATFWFPFI